MGQPLPASHSPLPRGPATRAARLCGTVLLLYGALGVAVQLRLPALAAAALGSLTGAVTFRTTPPELPGLGVLAAHYSARPWLPWAAWLAGLALVAWQGRARPAPRRGAADLPAPHGGSGADRSRRREASSDEELSAPATPAGGPGRGPTVAGRSPLLQARAHPESLPRPDRSAPEPPGAGAGGEVAPPSPRGGGAGGEDRLPSPGGGARARWIPALLAAGALGGIFLLATYARLNLLVPQARGLTEFPYDDEGVYAGAGQMVLQGILPYRDFFFAHPPLAALVYIPALVYHFTAWGSVTSFMIARYLSVAYSLAALLALFAVGWAIAAGPAAGGRRANALVGLTAAAIWAVDGRVVEINRKIMLDQPMILASFLALLAYVVFLRGLGSGGHPAAGRRLLLVAGALAAVSAFTKIQGLACMAALLLDLLWRVRRRPAAGAAHWGDLLTLGGGFAAVAVVVLGPFLVLAPGAVIRMVGFFQLLRPSDGVVLPPARIANLTAVLTPGPAVLENGPTTYLAALGFLALTACTLRAFVFRSGEPPAAGTGGRAAVGLWVPVVLWGFLNVLLFTYSRSFYTHYYVQLAAPLCLLGGAAWLPLLHAWGAGRARRPLQALAGALLLPALLLVPSAWQGCTTRYDDPIFAIVARFANDAVPPAAPVLATDEQFAFLASRPPSHTGSGYLIDSYGHMIFLGLGLGARSWADLLGAVLHGAPAGDAYAVMQRPAPQADFLDRAAQASLIIVHSRGFARLQRTTLNDLLARGTLRDRQPRYWIISPRHTH